jgi:hypothetical protein
MSSRSLLTTGIGRCKKTRPYHSMNRILTSKHSFVIYGQRPDKSSSAGELLPRGNNLNELLFRDLGFRRGAAKEKMRKLRKFEASNHGDLDDEAQLSNVFW